MCMTDNRNSTEFLDGTFRWAKTWRSTLKKALVYNQIRPSLIQSLKQLWKGKTLYFTRCAGGSEVERSPNGRHGFNSRPAVPHGKHGFHQALFKRYLGLLLTASLDRHPTPKCQSPLERDEGIKTVRLRTRKGLKRHQKRGRTKTAYKRWSTPDRQTIFIKQYKYSIVL